MTNKPPVLFGTPLSKSLENAHASEDPHVGPINRRRARLEKQQIVTDDQGRRRFHGAFTGGFSAGHFNSVDTTRGFQPKSFVSSRRGRDRDDISTSYDHRPEDYMDEEDFSEFGIAPKKIRLVAEYSKETNARTNVPQVQANSIGEKILRCMVGSKGIPKDENDSEDLSLIQKNDYHGLGYKPLVIPKDSTAFEDPMMNPLLVTLGQGQRLKISGEAFGVGVLDDDDDNDPNLHRATEYGLDNLANYEFSSKTLKHKTHSEGARHRTTSGDERSSHTLDPSDQGRFALDDFVLAKDVESLEICGEDESKYPRPVISPGWQMPTRDEPYVPPSDPIVSAKDAASLKMQAGKFSEKFADVKSTLKKCDTIEGRSGLVPYSDLRAIERPLGKSGAELLLAEDTTSRHGITIERKTLEWRPCSLLCRHFNVPNPYPDNAFCGLKPSEASSSTSSRSKAPHDSPQCHHQGQTYDGPAPLELRRSIFNVHVDEATSDADDENSSSEDDEKPQVIEIDESVMDDLEAEHQRRALDKCKESDQESDVVVMADAKREPEVINLLSSSQSDSSDEEAYGPPLPPSRQMLQSVDLSRAVRSSSQSDANLPDLRRRRRKKKKKSSKRL